MIDTRDHPWGCICRACEDLWDEIEAAKAEPEVCANCGAYFDAREKSKWQRCGRCRAGLEERP